MGGAANITLRYQASYRTSRLPWPRNYLLRRHQNPSVQPNTPALNPNGPALNPNGPAVNPNGPAPDCAQADSVGPARLGDLPRAACRRHFRRTAPRRQAALHCGRTKPLRSGQIGATRDSFEVPPGSYTAVTLHNPPTAWGNLCSPPALVLLTAARRSGASRVRRYIDTIICNHWLGLSFSSCRRVARQSPTTRSAASTTG